MSKVDKTQPDVLRVTQYIIDNANNEQGFSVCSAAKTTELNGISDHRIAEIMRDICFEPNGSGTLIKYTTVDDTDIHNSFAKWQLNAQAYFSYLSYLSLVKAEKANELAVSSIDIAQQANSVANKSYWVAIIAIVIGFITSVAGLIAALCN